MGPFPGGRLPGQLCPPFPTHLGGGLPHEALVPFIYSPHQALILPGTGGVGKSSQLHKRDPAVPWVTGEEGQTGSTCAASQSPPSLM